LAITVLGGSLRLFQLGAKGLSLDEAFSIWMAQRPLGEMLAWLVRIDQHPPLYYSLLHVWLTLGDGQGLVRGLSVLASTLTIPVVYLLGRRLVDGQAGLLAALLLAVSPFHVHYAQEARMYALLALNGSLAMLAVAHLFTDPQAMALPIGRQLSMYWRGRQSTGRWPALASVNADLAWLGYVVFTVAALMTHNTAVFLPLAMNVFVLGLVFAGRLRPTYAKDTGREGRLHPPALRNWLLAQAGVLTLWAAWLPSLITQGLGVYREFWLPKPTIVAVGAALGAFATEFLPPQPAAWVVAALFYLALTGWGVRAARRRARLLIFLIVPFIVPFAGELLVSLFRPIFYDRTLIWVTVPFILTLACGIRALRGRHHALAVVLVVLLLNGASLNAYFRDYSKGEWDEAAALVAERVRPDDLILFNATWVQIPFDYYFHRGYNRPVAEHGVPVDLFAGGELEPKMTAQDLPRLRSLVADHERVWLVYSHDWYTDPQGLIPLALGAMRPLRTRWQFYGVEIWEYGDE
jgi:uncharacterized membrane protein